MSPFVRRKDIITALERDQYEVLWSRVQHWTRRNLLKFWIFLKILKIYEIIEIFWNVGKFWNFVIFLTFWIFFVYCMGVTKWEGDSNFIHWFCTRVQNDFLLQRNRFLRINMLENGMPRVLLLVNKKNSKIEPYVIIIK
jgi:hypothetical protein